MSGQEMLNGALLVGCAYEIAALVSKGKLPTITHLLRTTGKKHHAGKVLLWMWCGFISWHFLEPLED